MSLVESVLDTNSFGDWLGIQTNSGRKSLLKQLNNWSYNEDKLSSKTNRFKRFKAAINKQPELYDDCNEIFREIAIIEKKLNILLSNESKLEKESYNELLFISHDTLRPLNFIPFILSLWSLIRIYILPGLSFIVPILILISPYIILSVLFKAPVTFHNYLCILQTMISGNYSKLMTDSSSFASFASSDVIISPTSLLKQIGVIGISVIQGILQPYWTYKHLSSIDAIINDHGKIIIHFRNLYEKLQCILKKHGFTFFKCPIPDLYNERDATARVILESSYFKLALRYIGSLEVIMCLAHKTEIEPVNWVKSTNNRPIFIANNTFDFNVSSDVRKRISINLNENQHALLTGPNKGGKSTALRALAISGLLAHTYGCSMGSLISTPFKDILLCLKPDDLPGTKSRFEREIEFTASTLKTVHPTLVFIDELYHSTNPPDALRSCDIYCNKLWQKTNIVSIISTHLFDFVENSPTNIQKLCCLADIDSSGNVKFNYTVSTGICKVSSVDELLKINGLI
jgi:energy-coupling factor transporter ATP-binding protein EcfA2